MRGWPAVFPAKDHRRRCDALVALIFRAAHGDGASHVECCLASHQGRQLLAIEEEDIVGIGQHSARREPASKLQDDSPDDCDDAHALALDVFALRQAALCLVEHKPEDPSLDRIAQTLAGSVEKGDAIALSLGLEPDLILFWRRSQINPQHVQHIVRLLRPAWPMNVHLAAGMVAVLFMNWSHCRRKSRRARSPATPVALPPSSALRASWRWPAGPRPHRQPPHGQRRLGRRHVAGAAEQVVGDAAVLVAQPPAREPEDHRHAAHPHAHAGDGAGAEIGVGYLASGQRQNAME